MKDHIFDLLKDLIDNDTLIIVGMSLLAYFSPEHRELIGGGLVGYLGSRVRRKDV